jgi:hypothetical protein
MRPTQTEIRERSYQIWEKEGRPDGMAWDHWLRAEAELQGKEAQEASSKPQKGGSAGFKAGGAKEPSGSA